MSLLYLIALPLLASFLAPLFKNIVKFISVMIAFGALLLVVSFHDSIGMVEHVAFDSSLAITFQLSSVSWLFLLLFSTVMLLYALYNLKNENSTAIFILTNLLMVGVFGLVLSHDIFNIYIFFEITGIASYILTSLNRDKKAYSGAIKYMLVGLVASIFLLLAIMLIYLAIGSLNLTTISENFGTIDAKTQFLILLSLFVGFGIKAEVFPFNFWVADIYQASRSDIASLFSAVVAKAYLFLFFHLAFLLGASDDQLAFLITLGILSFFFAEISALKSKDAKRVLAFSSLGQLGILFLAFAHKSELVVTGALFFVVVHSITKLMLFLSLDLLERKFDSSKLDIFSRFSSPFLFVVFLIGFLSLLGIPPFGGFIAKLTIFKGLAFEGAYMVIGIILLISLIEAGYLFSILSSMRGGEEREKVEIARSSRVLLGVMALFLIAVGLYPDWLLALCQEAAASMIGGVHV